MVFVLLDFAALILYDLRAFSFCGAVLELRASHRLAKPVSLLVNCLLLAAIFWLRLPVLLGFLIVYLIMLLEFCILFRGKILIFLFGSGDFLFHLMNTQMIVTALYVLLYRIGSAEAFFARFPSAVFLSLLLVTVFLEVSRRALDREAVRMLLRNDGQLLFATTSMMLIDIYLILLSVSYGGQAYSPMAAIFLLCTGILLFGAFYTAFQHALRMSLLLEYQAKSRALEDQLEQSNEHLAAARTAADTDALTQVPNRRYGLKALERQLSAGQGGCVCFLDIDHLKEVNDQYGHQEGDRYILRVVQTLRGSLAERDVLARLGGDEFLLLRPGAGEADTRRLLEQVRASLAASASRYRSSISYGVLALSAKERLSVGEVLSRVDNGMYRYKVENRERAQPEGQDPI